MGRETRAFFATMIRENLPAHSLIDADFAFVNDRLARHYGLHEVKGSNLQRVDLPRSSPYGGLLTQASVLKLSADGTSTSPVLRGVWIMDRLIGQPPPPPPPGIPAVEPDIRGVQTIRELIAKHTASKTCAGCHAKFDPVGLALKTSMSSAHGVHTIAAWKQEDACPASTARPRFQLHDRIESGRQR